jgi:hypothetical protein
MYRFLIPLHMPHREIQRTGPATGIDGSAPRIGLRDTRDCTIHVLSAKVENLIAR